MAAVRTHTAKRLSNEWSIMTPDSHVSAPFMNGG